jgi:hypothetical protein
VANSGDLAIAAMLIDFDIDAVPFASAIGKKVSDLGIRGSSVLSTNQLLTKLSGTDIVVWQEAIAAVYSSKTVRYKALFPNGRKPYQNGKETLRLDAISGLLLTIGTDLSLSTIKATIQSSYDAINTSIGTKVSNVGTVKIDITTVEVLIENLGVKMFKIFHELSIKFALTPLTIMSYIPFKLLQREKQAKTTSGIVSKAKVKKIWRRKWKDTAQIILKNTGTVPLYFYRSDNSKDSYSGIGQLVNAGQKVTVLFSALGATGLLYLMVDNQDKTTSGDYDVELV